MIRCECIIEKFYLQAFDELQNIKRVRKDEKGVLFYGDTFECTEKMAKYLTGENPLGKVVAKVIEVKPVIGHKDVEHITPLRDKEELDKLGESISKHIKPTKKKSKK